MIPRIIHYCWLSDDPIPENLQENMNTWSRLKDYTFMKWDFTRFTEDVPWVREAFENKKYAFACDYIRLYAVYHYGGIYMDMDMEVIRPFDDLLDSPLMLAYEDSDRFKIEAGCFGAEKGNPLIGECLAYYAGRHFVREEGEFDMIPLPDILGQVVQSHDIRIYGCDFFTAKSFLNGHIYSTENTYTIHHFAGSWLPDYYKEISKRTELYAKKYPGNLSRYLAIITYFTEKYGIIGGVRRMIRRAAGKKDEV